MVTTDSFEKHNDKSFEAYNDYIKTLIKPDTIDRRVMHLKPAGKFAIGPSGLWEAKPYPGYTIITPPFCDETGNIYTYSRLADVQQVLCQRVGACLATVKASSFHLTVADLVSSDRYNPEKDSELRAAVMEVSHRNRSRANYPLDFLLCGLGLFSTVVVTLVSTESKSGYNRLIEVRDLIYSNEKLSELNVQRKYPFTGHVTLAYVETHLNEDERIKIADAIKAINRDLFAEPLPFVVRKGELRKFEDMACYRRENAWATFSFT